MPRLDTRLESEGAEFLVLAQLLLARIPAYKTYTNMPGYDLVATNPERNLSAKIQVKSRWNTGASSFPIKSFASDFVVFCRLNRGNKKGTGKVRAPEYFVIPVEVLRAVWKGGGWGKAFLRDLDNAEQYRDRWDLVYAFLHDGEAPEARSGELRKAERNDVELQGVVRTIRAMIEREEGATKAEILAALSSKFPERKERAMAATLATQLSRLRRKAGPITKAEIVGRGRVYRLEVGSTR